MQRNVMLVGKGKAFSLGTLMQQGRVSELLAIEFAAGIATAGFSAVDRQELSSKLALLESYAARQTENRAQTKANRVLEAKAVAEAKAFKRRLDVAVADLYARTQYVDGFSMPVAREAFRVGSGGRLKNSTPKILEYLERVRPQVDKVKALLAPYFEGGDAVALLDAAATALKSADTRQELSLMTSPEATRDLYQLKGEVLFLIERLNRAGRAAFAHDPPKASQFNKNLLQRGRRGGVKVVEGGAKAQESAPEEGGS